MTTFTLRSISADDRTTLAQLWAEAWGSDRVVSRGQVHLAAHQGGVMAWKGERCVGFITTHREGDAVEVTSLEALVEGIGVGGALLAAASDAAREAGAKRLWLITTNDNTPALRFYQRHGMRLAALYRDAVNEARKIKPEIPLTGVDDIPITDEIELEIQF